MIDLSFLALAVNHDRGILFGVENVVHIYKCMKYVKCGKVESVKTISQEVLKVLESDGFSLQRTKTVKRHGDMS
jgi:hypothetical protein